MSLSQDFKTNSPINFTREKTPLKVTEKSEINTETNRRVSRKAPRFAFRVATDAAQKIASTVKIDAVRRRFCAPRPCVDDATRKNGADVDAKTPEKEVKGKKKKEKKKRERSPENARSKKNRA